MMQRTALDLVCTASELEIDNSDEAHSTMSQLKRLAWLLWRRFVSKVENSNGSRAETDGQDWTG